MQHAARDLVNRLPGFGWPALSAEHGRTLPANQGIVGLVVPTPLADKVADEQSIGPIIGLPGEPQRWIFLVETPAGRCPPLPVGIGLMSGLSRIPVPPAEGTCWVREPVTSRLPSFMALLNVIRNVVCRTTASWYSDPSTTHEQRQAFVNRLGEKANDR